MKKRILYFTALLMPVWVVAQELTSGTYTADVSATEIIWRGSKVTGKHHGTVDLKSGTLNFENGVLTGGTFEIDMTTIKNLDMAGGRGQERLENHLKSDDFFSVDTHPFATIVFTQVIPYGTTGDYRITGDLTIKGITKPVRFMANVIDSGIGISATAEITVDRSEYNVRYGSGSFFDNLGDNAIHDEFHLSVRITMIPS